MRIASLTVKDRYKLFNLCLSVLHADCIYREAYWYLCSEALCLSVLHADCISKNARMSIRYAVEYAVSR